MSVLFKLSSCKTKDIQDLLGSSKVPYEDFFRGDFLVVVFPFGLGDFFGEEGGDLEARLFFFSSFSFSTSRFSSCSTNFSPSKAVAAIVAVRFILGDSSGSSFFSFFLGDAVFFLAIVFFFGDGDFLEGDAVFLAFFGDSAPESVSSFTSFLVFFAGDFFLDGEEEDFLFVGNFLGDELLPRVPSCFVAALVVLAFDFLCKNFSASRAVCSIVFVLVREIGDGSPLLLNLRVDSATGFAVAFFRGIVERTKL